MIDVTNLPSILCLYEEEEDKEDYIARICRNRREYCLTWEEVASVLNHELNLDRSESYWRKGWKRKENESDCDSVGISYDFPHEEERVQPDNEELMALRVQKMKLSDERTQANAYLRRASREETIREIAHDFATKMNAKRMLEDYSGGLCALTGNISKSAILEVSDWHYGLICDNYWNKYDTKIAKERIENLLAETIARCERDGVDEIHVANLADLIAGRIHLTLRLQSRIDVITQIMEVSELLAQFLNELTKHFAVHYYDCLDNHSRIEPNKSDSLDMESLARITPWYIKERCPNVKVHENKFGADIINFTVCGHNVLGVHGDKDKPSTVVDNLTLMTHEHFDLVLTSHRHHFSCDEKNETVVVSNGSLMGVDSYAEKLRLSSKPSQNLIIVTPENVIDCIYRILV